MEGQFVALCAFAGPGSAGVLGFLLILSEQGDGGIEALLPLAATVDVGYEPTLVGYALPEELAPLTSFAQGGVLKGEAAQAFGFVLWNFGGVHSGNAYLAANLLKIRKRASIPKQKLHREAPRRLFIGLDAILSSRNLVVSVIIRTFAGRTDKACL